ncbi:MAG: protein kinase domain-containing protein [Anaerolineae bacterium]
MITCIYCGYINKPTAQYCKQCGRSLAVTHQSYAPLHSGQALKGGDYTISQRLGKGGMGAVYLATQTIAGRQRDVVVKELLDYVNPSEFQRHADYQEAVRKSRRRFEEEAGTLADLHHTGIPDIYDYFTEGQRNYIVMEYIAGKDLLQGLTHEDEQGRYVSGAPLPQPLVLEWGIQLCHVLEYLARQNPPVMHHDIKPANVILDANSGTVRLVDFGTAKARLIAQPGGRVGMQKSSIYGTEGYAAPEMYKQISSPRSDVYSLAATLYHLLTDDDPREHPFDFPELTALDPDLADALGKALSDDVNQRPIASALRAEMESLAHPSRVQPFTFESKDAAFRAEDLVPLCDRYWDEARRYLTQGDFLRWFRRLHRHDLLAFVRNSQSLKDRDAQLETLLHELDPNLAHPQVMPDRNKLDFGVVARGEQTEEIITLALARRGYTRVLLAPRQPWIEVEPTTVQLWGSPGKPQRTTVSVRVKTEKLPIGKHQGTAIDLSYDSKGRPITAEVEIAFWPSVLRQAGRLLMQTGVLLGKIVYWVLWGLIGLVLGIVVGKLPNKDLPVSQIVLPLLLYVYLLVLLILLDDQMTLAFVLWLGSCVVLRLVLQPRLSP